MKILQMSRWFFPHVGGASVRVYQIAKNLTEMGHEVHLLTHNPQSIGQCNLDEECPLYEKHPQGFYVYRLPYYKALGKNGNWALSIPLMAKKAIEIIEREKIDVILSHNPPYLVGAASLKASKLTGKPFVILVHDVWGASHYSRAEYIVGNVLQKMCIKRSKRIVAVSEGLKDILSKDFQIDPKRIFVSPTGIDPELSKLDPVKLKKVLKKYEKLGIHLGDKYVFFVGIMRKWAGVPCLIDAFAKMSKEHPKVKLLLVGGGGDKAEFEKQAESLNIRDKVIFTDSVPYGDVPYLISLAAIACAPFPSTSVTDQNKLMSPHKVLEYMAAGKPIIASSVGGMEKYIKDKVTGALCKPDDAKDLKEKIVYLLENPKVCNEVAKNAYEYVRKGGFEWKDSTKTVEKALKEALE